MVGVRDAIKYAYSNARVKAMESKLVGKATLERMLAAREPESMAAMLLQTHYKQDVELFGGVGVMNRLVDFVLSQNLGSETSRLISISPKDRRQIITAIVGVWDISNIKLVIEALESGKGYDDISSYVIESKYTGRALAKEMMSSKSTESAIKGLALQTPYSKLLRSALEIYKKTGSMVETSSAIEKGYYLQLGSVISELEKIDRNAAALIRKRIDMKNALTLLGAKKHGVAPQEVSGYLLPGGSANTSALEKLYKNSKSLESLAESIKVFDLREALASYDANVNKPLLLFEIAMMNSIFTDSLRTVRYSVLSFGTLVGFFYLKEMEVFALRVLIKGRDYGLSDEEIRGMISWIR